MDIKVNIVGSCVLRYTISSGEELDLVDKKNPIKVVKFIQSNNPLILTTPPLREVIDVEIDMNEDTKFQHGALYRWFMDLANRSLFKTLAENKADFLICDLNDITYDLHKIVNIKTNKYTYLGDTAAQIIWEKDKFKDLDITKIDIFEFLKTEYGKKLLDEALEYYENEMLKIYSSKQIILIRNYFTDIYLKNNETLVVEQNSIERNRIMNYCHEHFIKKVNPQVVLLPDKLIADEKHKWGKHPMHYIKDIYPYLYKCYKACVCKENESKQENLKNLWIEINSCMNDYFYCGIYNSCKFNNKDYLFYNLRNNISLNYDCNSYKKCLVNTSEINAYLELLYKIKDRIIIAVAVKDTPGHSINYDILEKIHKIGFSKYTSKLWLMYIGIVANGKVIYDEIADEIEKPIYYETEINDISIQLFSAAFRNGNKASIIIKNREYAMNERGINIVVLDSLSGDVIDSVSYDMHIMKNFQHMNIKNEQEKTIREEYYALLSVDNNVIINNIPIGKNVNSRNINVFSYDGSEIKKLDTLLNNVINKKQNNKSISMLISNRITNEFSNNLFSARKQGYKCFYYSPNYKNNELSIEEFKDIIEKFIRNSIENKYVLIVHLFPDELIKYQEEIVSFFNETIKKYYAPSVNILIKRTEGIPCDALQNVDYVIINDSITSDIEADYAELFGAVSVYHDDEHLFQIS